MTGSLVLVATPIGNLGDLSPRAVETLAGADVVACEDTRRTRKLFSHAGVAAPPMVVVNEHTERAARDGLVDRAREGQRVVLVTDAGMPGVSDPGADLVAACVAAGVDVEVVPGPSAALAALVVSGLPTDRFCVEGFLPRKGSGRAARLRAVADEVRTIVLFEGPHRLERTLGDLVEVAGGERPVAVVRELTKRHEEIHRGDLTSALAWAREGVKGEVVVVLAGAAPPEAPDDATLLAAAEAHLEAGATVRDAARATVVDLGVGRRRVYELLTGPERG